ncbi:MAG: hypothetical protein QM817_30100 [Archangium sp.]
MTPNDAATVLIADSLERGLPLADGLSDVKGIGFLHSAAQSGKVREVLTSLRVSNEVVDVTERWPKVLAPTLRRLEEIPGGFASGLHVAQTGAYVFFIAAVQLFVGTALRNKVLPVFFEMAKDRELPYLGLADSLATVFLVLTIPLFAWLAAGALGWRRLPGWGRELERAKQAALGAALLESGAPDDVRLAFFSKQKWLGDGSLDAVDLDVVRARCIAAAEVKLQRFVVTARVVSLSVLTLNALGMLAAVYATLAQLPMGAM